MLQSTAPSTDSSAVSQTLSPDDEKRRRHRALVRLERLILLPTLGVALLARLCLGVVKVDGHSMEPTYHTGDTLYILKTYRYLSPLKPGDIVVAHLNHTRIRGESIVKRVVFVQNALGNAPYPATVITPNGPAPFRNVFGSYSNGRVTVPPNGVIVMGDNFENSMDSRDFGPLRGDEVIGKVVKL